MVCLCRGILPLLLQQRFCSRALKREAAQVFLPAPDSLPARKHTLVEIPCGNESALAEVGDERAIEPIKEMSESNANPQLRESAE